MSFKNRGVAAGLARLALGLALLSGAGARAEPATLSVSGALCRDGAHPSLADRAEQVAALRDSIERSLSRTSPNDSFPEAVARARLFGGNFDWHSSVHAHWALLSLARATRDAALESRLLARITPRALEDERARLNRVPSDPNDEMPYGQAWLLLMLRELERRQAGQAPEVRAFRREVEARILSHLEASPFPESGGALIRTHRSWLFAYTLLKMSGPTPERLARFLRLQARVDANRAAIERARDNRPGDFLFLPAVLSVLDETHPTREPWRRYEGSAWAPPSLPVTPRNAHQSGAVMVSVWPHAIQASRGDRLSCELFTRTLNGLFANRAYWAFDPARPSTFDTVGHWVPQFMWMGLLLEQGLL